MHASLSLWQDLKILSTEEREEVEAMRNGEMTSGKKPAEALTHTPSDDVIVITALLFFAFLQKKG